MYKFKSAFWHKESEATAQKTFLTDFKIHERQVPLTALTDSLTTVHNYPAGNYRLIVSLIKQELSLLLNSWFGYWANIKETDTI